MGKITKTFRALTQILRRPYLLNLILDSEEVWKDYVVKKYNLPNGLPCVDFSNFMPAGGMDINPFAFLDGGSLLTDIALLKSLCQRIPVSDYLEIGTWRGESVANVAATGVRCVTVNLPDEEMRRMGLDEDYIRMHRYFSEGLPNVEHVQAHSHHFDFTRLNRKFDLIFIDGDHHSPSIALDTKTAFSLLKDERSVIVWHDYALSPETPRYEVLSGILDGCPAACRPQLFHVSNTLCAIYTQEVLPSQPLKANERKGRGFSVTVDSR